MYQPTPGMAPWYLKTRAGSLGSEDRVFKPTIQPDVLELGHKGHCGLPVCQTHSKTFSTFLTSNSGFTPVALWNYKVKRVLKCLKTRVP